MTRRVRKHPHAGMGGTKRDFVKLVGELAHGRGHDDVLRDFLDMAFCALAVKTYRPDHPTAVELEARYMRTVEQRPAEYIRRMPELLGLLQVGIFEHCDFLGEVSGELGALNEHMGQFFTPFAVSVLNAQLLIDRDVVEGAIAERGYMTLSEPACGAGGMVLAVADVLDGLGFDACQHMRVWATDLSVTAFQMAYVQLSLRGLAAHVMRGNTLTLETFETHVTPGLLLQEAALRTRGIVAAVRTATEAVDAMALTGRTELPQETVATSQKHGVFDTDRARAISAENHDRAHAQLDLFAGGA